VRLVPPTAECLADAFLTAAVGYQVVHFSCHANQLGIVIEDALGRERLLPTARLVEILRGDGTRPAPALVVLNACETLDVAHALVDQAGVLSVIAIQPSINDVEASLLAERLYRYLSAGRMTGEAHADFRGTLTERMESGDVPRYGDPAERAERVKLVGAADLSLAADDPPAPQPLLLLHPVPQYGSLPMDTQDGFVGRWTELVALARWFAETGQRGYVISGVGGIGKTSIALNAALRHAHRFSALAFASAKAAEDFGPIEVLRVLDAALNVASTPGEIADPIAAIGQRLNARPVLLLLDNLESVSDGRIAELSRALGGLDPHRGSRVLMTMRPRERDPLTALKEIRRREVRKLDPASSLRLAYDEARRQDKQAREMPGAIDVLAEIPVQPVDPGQSAELDRLRKQAWLSTLDLRGVAALADLAAASFDHPAILRLAVAMIAKHGWAKTRERLKEVAGCELEEALEEMIGHMVDDMCAAGGADDPASLDVLYAALPFRGGAAASLLRIVLLGEEPEGKAVIHADDRLQAAVTANLLTCSADRYDLDEPVRAYLGQRRPPDAETELLYRRRHAAVFLKAAREAEEKWDSGEVSLAALPEWDNIAAALDWLASAAERDDDDGRLLVVYVQILTNVLRNRYDIPRAGWLAAAESAARSSDDPRDLANVLKAQGDVLAFQDRRAEALAKYEAALDLFRAVGDRLGEANVLKAQGDVLAFQKQNAEALAKYEAALDLFRAVGARLGEANVLQAQGDVLAFQDRRAEALAKYEAALDLFRAVGARLGEANVLAAKGQLEIVEGHQEQGDKLLEEAITLYKAIGDHYSVPAQTGNYGWALLRAGDPDGARPYLLRAAQGFAEIGLDDYAARHLQAADVSTDPAELKRQLRTVIAQRREAGDRERLVQGLAALCQLCRQTEDWAGLQPAGEELIALSAADADTWEMLGDACSNQNDEAAAADAYAQAVAIAPDRAMLRRNYANSLITLDRLNEAAAQLDIAERLDPDAAYLALRRAELAKTRGDTADALRWAEEALRRQPGWDEAQQILDELG
jgi:tetratricopeptide (TPR) repeat protein